MWRTSWMSREVIVLPAFIALVGLWWLAREFFHRATQAGVKRVKLGFVVLAFAVPTFSLVWALTWGDIHLIWVALPVQYLGLLAERWFFFAQARHPQNLYYQVVS
jgi:DMSO reductase anchor subunit